MMPASEDARKNTADGFERRDRCLNTRMLRKLPVMPKIQMNMDRQESRASDALFNDAIRSRLAFDDDMSLVVTESDLKNLYVVEK